MKTDLLAFLEQDIQQYRDIVERMYEDSQNNIMPSPETLNSLEKSAFRAATAQHITNILNDSQDEQEALRRIAREAENCLYTPGASIVSMQVFKAVMDKL